MGVGIVDRKKTLVNRIPADSIIVQMTIQIFYGQFSDSSNISHTSLPRG